MRKFKRWLFLKALDFIIRNVNEYEDEILNALGVDPRLTMAIDWVTDLLLKVYMKFKESQLPQVVASNMPKLERYKDKTDPFNLRWNPGEKLTDHIKKKKG